MNGNPVEKLDLSDIRNLLRYEIYEIKDGLADLRMPEEEIPNPSHIIGLGKVTGIIDDIPKGIENITGTIDNPPLLHKAIEQFVTDENWWFKA